MPIFPWGAYVVLGDPQSHGFLGGYINKNLFQSAQKIAYSIVGLLFCFLLIGMLQSPVDD